MSKRLILMLALAFVVGITFTAYAEVQNVKVSGDITVKGVARDNFDLTKAPENRVNMTSNNTLDDKDKDILSITRVRVDADLTDNVSATVRLLNERAWNGDSTSTTQANRNIGLNTNINVAGDTINRDAVNLDLAYVALKEFLYSPLSLTIGRQELRFGNGFIVGDPDTNIYSAVTNLSEGDLSARKSFDALRATLDYNPLVVDLVYAKTEEGAANLNDDVNLYGGNASYALNKDTILEGFFFSKIKGTNAPATWNVDSNNAFGFTGAGIAGPIGALVKDESDIVNTIGMRAVNKTVKNLALDGQIAYQFGRYNPKWDPNARIDASGGGAGGNRYSAKNAARSAWAAQLMANYDLKDVKYVDRYISKYSPSVKASYTYFSGANRDGNKTTYKGWDPMFEDQTIGHIMNAIFADTNMHKLGLGAKAKLTDDITANFDYVSAWFAKTIPAGRSWAASGIATTTGTGRQFISKDSEQKFMGNEFDAAVTYDYTEDVQFSLLGGVFLPNKTIQDTQTGVSTGRSATATELIGSMKVTF